MINGRRRSFAAGALALLAWPQTLRAHGDAAHEASARPAQQQLWGIAGDAAAVTRTIGIEMSDAMRFTPDRIEVRQGETLRLVFRNRGKVLHEFVLGTKKALDAHAAAMQRMPEMQHDDPWMVHVPPGKTGELVWKFNRAGEFDFACLIPGHYQAGMVGKVRVAAKP